jgi:hypothetical protein
MGHMSACNPQKRDGFFASAFLGEDNSPLRLGSHVGCLLGEKQRGISGQSGYRQQKREDQQADAFPTFAHAVVRDSRAVYLCRISPGFRVPGSFELLPEKGARE